MLTQKLEGAAKSTVPAYIEDVFSTWLYTGNGSTQPITNGIDLAGEGGLVWFKSRSTTNSHRIFDTARGIHKFLNSSDTGAQTTNTSTLTAFNSTGFDIGSSSVINTSGESMASWTFRKAPKFFDVVTYTGDGVANRQVTHSLGSAPGTIIVKCTNTTSDWWVWHRGDGTTARYLRLNTTAAGTTGWSMQPVSGNEVTAFEIRGGTSNPNVLNNTYVAYLFAHDAGGFGLTGTDNVISCGAFSTDGSGNATVTLGYELQWVLYKPSTAVNNWKIFDNMRGMVVGNGDQALYPNTSGAEVQDDSIQPAATGFSIVGGDASATHIYIAIRRGPMKVPESGTSVFAVDTEGQFSPKPPGHTSGFVTDMALVRDVTTTNSMLNVSRLTGDQYLITSSTAAAGSLSFIDFDYMNGWADLATTNANYYSWMFRRAPGFFDEVCYTGTGVAGRTVAHNLAAVPEMMIVKKRSSATQSDWFVYHSGMVDLTYPNPATQYIRLNLTNSWVRGASGAWNNTQPTSSVFSLGDTSATNASGQTFVAYLFASAPGVSKVGSFTGNGSSQTINCGFTAGARFVLIKAASTTGDWLVADSARGIVSGNDPYLELNTTNAEVTGEDWLDTDSSGFVVNEVSGSNANTNGVTYIYLAIA